MTNKLQFNENKTLKLTNVLKYKILIKEKELDMEIFMLQCNNYIHSVEQPYSMETVIRVPNALYCRYNGPENSIKFAYDKINLEAFERNIEIENYNYTIFLENNLEEDIIIADVFVPIAKP